MLSPRTPEVVPATRAGLAGGRPARVRVERAQDLGVGRRMIPEPVRAQVVDRAAQLQLVQDAVVVRVHREEPRPQALHLVEVRVHREDREDRAPRERGLAEVLRAYVCPNSIYLAV